MKEVLKSTSSYLRAEIDVKRCNPISMYSCFLSGFTSCISFSVSRQRPFAHEESRLTWHRHATYGVASKRKSIFPSTFQHTC